MDLKFSPDSQWLVSVGFTDTFIAWHIGQTQVRRRIATHQGDVLSLAASADGSIIASGGEDSVIRVTRVNVPMEVIELEGHHGPVRAMALRSDGTMLASGSDDDRRIRLWDLAARNEPRDIETSGDVIALAISPDGFLLASASEDSSSIQLWSPRTGEALGELKGHDGEVRSLSFSRDGEKLVSGGDDQTVRMWSLASRAESMRPIVTEAGVSQAELSADGATVASAGSTFGGLFLWNLGGSSEPVSLPTDNIAGGHHLTFSHSGRSLAYTAGEFRSRIIIWNLERSRPDAMIETGGTALALAFMLDDKRLVSGHSGGAVLLWDVDVTQWQARACQIANRDLTREEWSAMTGGNLPYRKVCPDLPAQME
jgi:Tol biopolymer transport system component